MQSVLWLVSMGSSTIFIIKQWHYGHYSQSCPLSPHLWYDIQGRIGEIKRKTPYYYDLCMSWAGGSFCKKCLNCFFALAHLTTSKPSHSSVNGKTKMLWVLEGSNTKQEPLLYKVGKTWTNLYKFGTGIIVLTHRIKLPFFGPMLPKNAKVPMKTIVHTSKNKPSHRSADGQRVKSMALTIWWHERLFCFF